MDRVIDRLNATQKAISFHDATDAVVEGFDLGASSNRHYGASVFVATRGDYEVEDLSVLLVGRSLAAGAREHFPECELVCSLENGQLLVAVHALSGQRLSRHLVARRHDRGSCDEGFFTWFGPVEDVCTPWSDNDRAQCQAVTVDRLREFARAYKSEQTRTPPRTPPSGPSPSDSMKEAFRNAGGTTKEKK